MVKTEQQGRMERTAATVLKVSADFMAILDPQEIAALKVSAASLGLKDEKAHKATAGRKVSPAVMAKTERTAETV